MRVDLAAALAGTGLTIVQHDGWRTRGRDFPGKPDTILVHHTATSARAKGDLPTLRLLIEGRSDLPGPLCQLALSRTGVVHILAAGKANHAGRGAWRGQTSSSGTIGIEAEHPGGAARWPSAQHDAYVQLCAALCRHLHVDPHRVCGHKEWALPAGRKVDPNLDMDVFRAQVRAHLVTPAPPTVQEDDVARLIKSPDKSAQFGTDGVSKWHVPKTSVLADLIRTGVYGDGKTHIVGQETIDALPLVEK